MDNPTILIENGTVLTMDGAGTLHQPGYVLVRGSTIAAVGAGQAPAELRAAAGQILDAAQMLVVPGMVNGHTHLFQTFIRGLADDKPLLEWLKSCIWPVAQHMTSEECELAALVGMVENLRSGATSIIDHHYIHADPQNDDGVVRAAQASGVRLLLARGWADMNYHPALMETPDRIVAETTRIYETYHGKGDGRVRVEFGPLIPWGCSDATMLRTHALARQWGVGTHIHVAETRIEVEMELQSRGKRHIEWLADLGILGPDVQLAHGVWLDDHELDLIARSGAVVVHCPVSNMYLASGAARVPEMLRRGVHVALASDGPGSNNNQDMLATLKTAALLAKLSTLDAMALFPRDVLGMAYHDGALAFGLPQAIGSLEVGKKADLVLIDLMSAFAMPVHNPLSAMVYSLNSGSVDTVMVDGRVLMQGKKITVFDEQALLKEAWRVCRKLFERAGVSIQ